MDGEECMSHSGSRHTAVSLVLTHNASDTWRNMETLSTFYLYQGGGDVRERPAIIITDTVPTVLNQKFAVFGAVPPAQKK